MKMILIPCPISENTAKDVLPTDVSKYILLCRHYLVENIRTARRFISELKLGINIDELTFDILDKDSTRSQVSSFISKYKDVEYVGVLSEAGCPGIADPGALAVSIAQEMDIEVIPLVGPSSILLALMGSGFSGQNFTFHGYLPIDKELKAKKINLLARDIEKSGHTHLFIETPFRNNALLEDIINHSPANLLVCIACDVTSANGFIKTKSAQAWKKECPDLHKRPCIFLLGQ
jgi:16S rRNA (cytidine1402-2'-O)-methyltransferase